MMKKENYIFNKKKHIICFIFGYKCQICNCSSHKMHVHHLDQDHYNNDAFNLLPLCKDCHIRVHKLNLVFNILHTSEVNFQLEKLNTLL